MRKLIAMMLMLLLSSSFFAQTNTKTKYNNVKVMDSPDFYGNTIHVIKKSNTDILCLDYSSGFYYVQTGLDSMKGWINEIFIIGNDLEQLKDKFLKQQIEKKKIQNGLKYKEDKERYTKSFGQDVALKLLNHEVWIGMTTNMAILSLGRPDDIKTYVFEWGKHETYIYETGEYKYKMLFFEKDTLKSISY